MVELWIMGDDTAVQIVSRAKPLAKLDAITMPRHIILNQPQENRSMQIVDSRSLNPLRIPWQHAFDGRLFLREPVNAVRRFPFDTAERANDWRSGAQLEQRFSQHQFCTKLRQVDEATVIHDDHPDPVNHGRARPHKRRPKQDDGLAATS